MILAGKKWKYSWCVRFGISLSTVLLTTAPTFAVESTMPASYPELISSEAAKNYVYTEDGDFTAVSNLPCYQWMPANQQHQSIIIGIHGLTLHGRRFRVLARTMAINDIGFVAMDMYGFGRCRFEDNGKAKPKGDKTEINHEQSYQSIVKLTRAVKAKYPNVPIIAMGESLGCTFCIRLAGDNQDLIQGVILSAPAVRVNPKMYASAHDLSAGVKALVTPHHQVDLRTFLTELVSTRPEISNEMLDDPFIVKSLSLKDLLDTDTFVDKTVEWSRTTSPFLPMLVIQGSNDRCVLPQHLADLMMNMRSNDMRISWKGSYGHLQLETAFLRASIIDSIGMWLQDHSPEGTLKLKKLEHDIADLGGTLVR